MTNVVPPLSVGLPVFNGAGFLTGALDSILCQTYGDFELVVSDNGSTDATEEICRAYAAADPRIRYVRSGENRGASWNFSHVVHLARGELFRFASHDDLLAPTLLERCLEVREQEPDAVLWYPRAVEIDVQGRPLREFEDSIELLDPRPHRRLRRFLDVYSNSNGFFGIMPRSVLLTTRLLDDFHSSDVVLLGELALRGRFIEVDEPLFQRRWEQRSAPTSKDAGAVDRWFNPQSRRKHYFRRTRLFREMARSIVRAPIPTPERVRALGQLGAAWGPRYGRTMLGEVKLAAAASLGRAS